MKKVLIATVLILCVFLVGCLDIQFGNSVKGNWVLLGYKEIYCDDDTCYSEEDMYNPKIDQYYSATMIKITDDQMIVYKNGSDLDYYEDEVYMKNRVGDTLYFSYLEYEDTIAVAYYFNEQKNMAWILDDDVNYRYEMHLQKFNGEIPPDSWVTELEDDEYEPDGDIENATSISLNRTQSHTLTQNDMDYYCFRAEEGRSYLIRGLGYFNFEIFLYNQHGDSLAYDYRNSKRIDGLSSESRSVILWTCESDADYYPMIRPANRFSWNDYQGYYQMLIEEVDTNDIEYREPVIYLKSSSNNKTLGIFDRILNK